MDYYQISYRRSKLSLPPSLPPSPPYLLAKHWPRLNQMEQMQNRGRNLRLHPHRRTLGATDAQADLTQNLLFGFGPILEGGREGGRKGGREEGREG